MKKLFFLVCSLVYANGFSQSHDNGTLSFQVNFDAGYHSTESESSYMGTVYDQGTSVAGTTMAGLTMHYNFVKWFSAGFNFSFGSYIEDPENAEADGNKVSFISVDARFYPVNKDKFNWFAGIEYGYSGLEINRKVSLLNTVNTIQYNYTSPHLGLYTGFNWYFANFIGLNFQVGMSNHQFDLKEYSINGTNQDLTNYEIKLNTVGPHIKLGLSFKIN